MDEKLRAELIAMSERDQQIRAEARAAAGTNGQVPDDVQARWQHIDRDHTNRLAQIVAQRGWPGREVVGDDGARAAWLLAQHADQDISLQQRFLDLLRAAVLAGQADQIDLAYLTDRVAVHRGIAQLYGTQLTRDDSGSLVPEPISDPDQVDRRRAAIGLPPMAQYLRDAASPQPEPGQ